MLIPEMAPRLYREGLPDNEGDAAWLVETALSGFEGHVRDFNAALTLFDFSEAEMRRSQAGPQHPAFGWMFVAARDGGMSIYHAYTVLDGVRHTLATTKELTALVDRKALKAAGGVFHTHFRSFVDVRDAIAHIGEKMKTPEKFAEHSFSGSFEREGIKAENVKGLTLTNHLAGRRYTNTWEGKLMTYELSGESLARLDEAKQHLWSAFRQAEADTRAKWMANLEGRRAGSGKG